MRSYYFGRFAIHALVLVFAICELGISANIVALAGKYELSLNYVNLALAVSVLTIVALIPVRALDRLRQNALPSWTAVELAWTGVLWVLWLASAAYSADMLNGLDCSGYSTTVVDLAYVFRSLDEGRSVCQQVQAIEALAWLNWILLFALFTWLLTTAIIYHPHTSGAIWTSSMSDYQPSGPGAGFGDGKIAAEGGALPMAQTGTPQQGMGYGYGAPGGQMQQVQMQMPPMAGTPATQVTGTAQGHPGVAQV